MNNYSRVIQLENIIKSSKAKKIIIDHHITPTLILDIILYDPKAPATSILIFKLIKKMGDIKLIDKDIATCLYTGISTDTGNFSYSSVTSETHKIIANLLDKGIDISNINSKISSTYSYYRMKLLGKTIKNIKVLPVYRTAYMTINLNNINNSKYKNGDHEGFVNYGLRIKNIIFSVMFIEDSIEKNTTKISFRSKGNFDVNFFAKKYFNGGGHKNASGGILNKKLPEVIEYFLSILKIYKDKLNFN